MRTSIFNALLCLLLISSSCAPDVTPQGTLDESADLFPDYDQVTVPYNIAPLNVSLKQPGEYRLLLSGGGQSFQITPSGGHFNFPKKKWRRLTEAARGQTVSMTLLRKDGGRWLALRPIQVRISEDAVDPYMVYRRIATRYGRYDRMGIYQRELSSFTQSPVFLNSLTGYNCVNCHTFPAHNPDRMILHLRNLYPATMLVDQEGVTKLNTKTPQTISPFVYPSWHPTERFIAFSNNLTKQDFFMHSKNVLEVYDGGADIVVYDIEANEVLSSPLIKGDGGIESYPVFSPDGKSLYFCASPSVEQMPRDYQIQEFSLCRIDFDPDSRTFGDHVDTLYNGPRNGKSVSFPKISPDGRLLVFTLQDFGSFAAWHPDSDLYMLDIPTGEIRALEAVNSDQADGYHSWSSDGRWMAISSRRFDGNHTLPYICHVDPDGTVSKPFLLPQENPLDYYMDLTEVFNLPEFVTGKVNLDARSVALSAINEPGLDVVYAGPSDGTDQKAEMPASAPQGGVN